jgi:copper chaperone CopZ
VRSALLDVMGVTRVQVMLDTGEAIVTYDPSVTTTEAMLASVNSTTGPFAPFQFTAEVKASP